MSRPQEPVQNEYMKRKTHHGTEIEKVFGDATCLDVGEIREGFDVGRIRQPQDPHDNGRGKQEGHASQAGHPTPTNQLAILRPLEL
jgi:hypothetical protein